LKGNEDKNDREHSPSLQMLKKDGNIMNGWRIFPTIEMLKEEEI
jgi:hypothetical protein